jgi:hypothetical protein
MSEPKICPYITTAQIVAQALQVARGEALVQAGMNLQGIQGIGGSAQEPTRVVANPRNPIILEPAYKNRITPEMAADLNSGKVKLSDVPPGLLKPVADSLSVNCIQGLCENWCAEHGKTKCGGGGCDQCQIAAMTQAFTAALEAQGSSLGLASARKLLDKAHENFEEHQETPA